jgi:hypothetical protein
MPVLQQSTATEFTDPLSELVAEALEGILGRRRGDLAVDVHRHGDLAVPQDRHRHPRVDVKGHEQ